MSEPAESWTFREREARIKEPMRRWLIGSDGAPESVRRTYKRLDPARVEGLWQGYQLPCDSSDRCKEGNQVFQLDNATKELLSPSKDDASEFPAKRAEVSITTLVTEWSQTAQSELELLIASCEMIGGPYGQQRYVVRGSAREGGVRYKVSGLIQQVGESSHGKRVGDLDPEFCVPEGIIFRYDECAP